MTEETITISDEALRILNAMPFDPNAKHDYEHMSGGMVWSDELPRFGSREWQAVSEGYAYRFLIAARRDITLGVPSPRFQSMWQQVEMFAPNWPGLRPERRSLEVRKRLLAAERLARKCYKQMFGAANPLDAE
jgi:hypothetical protein